MPPIDPSNPAPWTLRLKHHKTTILIHISPLTTLKSIKQSLLKALQERTPSGILNGHQIPNDASDIRLAKAVDPLDLDQGWEEISVDADSEGIAKSIGMKNGGALAFRFVEEEEKTEDEDEDEMVLDGSKWKGQWDVVIPKFDDDFGLLVLTVGVTAIPVPGFNFLTNSKGFSCPILSSSAGGKAICISGNVAVQASATNRKLNIANPTNQYAATETFVEYFQANSSLPSSSNGGPATVSGTYNINAKLCYPVSSTASNLSTVQFLIHGINFDKLYWNIPGQSYLDAAAAAGYVTLSYDRLGTGLSDHPDPIQVVQSALHVEIAHQLIQSLRSGAVGGVQFQNVVGIGHSYGSIQTVGLAVSYPKDLDAIILQGFTMEGSNIPATIAAFHPSIAAQNDPVRFGRLPNGYQVVNSAIGDQTAFYRYPNFSPSTFAHLNAKKQTFSLGDFFTLTDPVSPATAFTGPVSVVNGQNDFIFCASDCGYPSDLGAGVLSVLFPAASSLSTSYLVPGTGHGINAHTTAPQAYKQMVAFIRSAGL
ncbi:hypothetical protein FKW77_008952 [Venturia effusa]|uniref:AB hydrolase-1 domain-containing protein n=1 Tax=Venturia effusa TaxID=50376 RepID=A0A517L3Y1_9PEZI|nr:hypothetical protein FKW77_008952 [Venturia effusa]